MHAPAADPGGVRERKGEGNRRALRRLVERGRVPGVLAYQGKDPVGWCAVEPRTAFPRLERSRLFSPIDDRPAWSIVCLFVRADRRGQGVSRALIEGAVKHARRHGARLVEAYPVEPRGGRMPGTFAWTGIASVFQGRGFIEVARRSATHPYMRQSLGGSPR